MTRNQQIIRTSIVGIAANVILAAFKAAVGAIAGSIAIVMDAVNNLSDALSSVITIAGTKLSERKPDKKHPFGYGRVEYMTAILIAVIVIAAGVSSLIESIRKIFEPVMPSYTRVTLIVIIAAIIIKLLLGTFVKHQGKKLESDALQASGADALFDAVVTSATLLSAMVMLLWDINLDGWLGVLVSLVIVKAGAEMLMSPVGDLLGRSITKELQRKIISIAREEDQVKGVSDIILNNYGPNTMIGTIHVTVDDTLSASQIHLLSRRLSASIYQRLGINITVGIYAYPTRKDDLTLWHDIQKILSDEQIESTHAFYLDHDSKTVTFDMVVAPEVVDEDALLRHVTDKLKSVHGEYSYNIIVDHNYIEA